MLFDDVVPRLEAAFQHELPGEAAQDVLAPIPRREWPAGSDPARIRNAAGLVLVYPHSSRASWSLGSSSGDAHIVLTVRADTLGRHSGQVALPGGVVDPGETFEQAALREAHEEVALPLDGVRVLGALTPLDIPVSGFRLHPIVAARDARPSLTPSDGEVARILEVPLAALLAENAVYSTERVRDGRKLLIPAFHLHGDEVWGATAMVLAEFLALLGWSRSRVA
jgi:8-oxo-dGTP pyrophosphatase MutT (NUDIX family)